MHRYCSFPSLRCGGGIIVSRSLLRTVRRKLNTEMWAVTEIYSCPHAEQLSNEAALWIRVPSGFGGRMGPRAQQVTIDNDFFGKASDRIVAQYRTLTNDEYMERHPSKAIVSWRGAARGEATKEDRDGNTIEGVDKTDLTGKTQWVRTKGGNMIYKPQVVFRAHGCVSSKTIYLDQFADKLGMVNSTFMTRFGQYGAGVGELLFMRMAGEPVQSSGSKYWVDYDFLWTGEKSKKWNEMTISRRFEKHAMVRPVYNTVGVATGEKRVIYQLLPVEESGGALSLNDTTRTATLFESANLSPINAICQW